MTAVARSCLLAWSRPALEAPVEVCFEAPHPLRAGERYRVIRRPKGGYHGAVPGGYVITGNRRMDPVMWELELHALDSVVNAAFVAGDGAARRMLREISNAMESARTRGARV